MLAIFAVLSFILAGFAFDLALREEDFRSNPTLVATFFMFYVAALVSAGSGAWLFFKALFRRHPDDTPEK
jgi:hypothetical protein